MEIHQLRYFLEVARVLNFSRAAERCHVSQPALSQQIMKLEEELGDRLFAREARAVRLTPAGEALREHAERIVGGLEHAKDAVAAARGRARGRVTVGVIPTVAPYVMPGWLKAFVARHPAVEVVVAEDQTARLARAVESGELDLAVASLPVAGRGLVATELFTESLWLALPEGHALAKAGEVALDAVSDEAFILLQDGHCLAGQALEFCAARGFAPKVSFRSGQMETIQAFVAAGMGLSMVPEMARRGAGGGVVYRRLAGRQPRRKIGLLRAGGRDATGAMRALTRFLREEAATRAEE